MPVATWARKEPLAPVSPCHAPPARLPSTPSPRLASPPLPSLRPHARDDHVERLDTTTTTDEHPSAAAHALVLRGPTPLLDPRPTDRSTDQRPARDRRRREIVPTKADAAASPRPPPSVTIGILLGIQVQRQASGQPPPFVKPVDNTVNYETTCALVEAISAPSKDQKFALNPNQWGVKAGDPGFLCMNATLFNNQTYATTTSAPAWSIWWQFNQILQANANNVHAFSNIMVQNSNAKDDLPAALGSITNMPFDVEWTMRLDNETTQTDVAVLKANDVNSNVAVDMFMDADESNSKVPEKADFEVMVWFAAFGASAKAVGEDLGPVTSHVFNGTTYDLFVHTNPTGQLVLTWKAQTPTFSFHGDLQPFLDEIFSKKNASYPTSKHYLGYLAFGSEAYYSAKTVKFNVPSMALDVQKS
ncbi:hypothetical protein DCS_00055 [Drechmeria coniospora]|uniref:Concanavalin A-like lectin/glucanase n=1 Tax=Drechmeria coniospora TaxID=98403 RepID=A0A151GPC8_DRECN|nr:hypothetical protein DCS_00055 [Drechmeria coniospora]KYK58928.1 hypothetical protein DCS_00055 [Drechmeria coniospora]